MTVESIDSESQKLERSTLGRQIAEAIRREIIFGRMTPGTKLGQQQVCERFGTSRMPVRDALRQLTYEGFLVSDGGRHSVVAKMNAREIEDTFLIEGMLHGLAARRVAETAPQEALDELRARHEAMVASADDAARTAELNWHFHRRINQLANSRKLTAALRTVGLLIPKDMMAEFPEWVGRATEEHHHIVAAMHERDGVKTESLVKEHVAWAGKDLVAFLERSGVDLD
jgi:DNA-binding GntR family transcriptional regulator